MQTSRPESGRRSERAAKRRQVESTCQCLPVSRSARSIHCRRGRRGTYLVITELGLWVILLQNGIELDNVGILYDDVDEISSVKDSDRT